MSGLPGASVQFFGSLGTADIWITLADHYSSRKDVEACRLALRRLKCFEQLATDSGNIPSKIRSIAKKHNIEKSDYDTPTAEDWRELGLIELTIDTKSEPVEFGYDETFGYFAVDSEGHTCLFSVELRDTKATAPELTFMQSTKGSKSWSTGSISFGSQPVRQRHSNGPDNSGIQIEIEQAGAARFRITTGLQSRSST